MTKKGDYTIPFDKAGNQLSYDESWRGLEMMPNFEFEDTLIFQSYGKGRSAVTFTMVRPNGLTVNCFISDFTEMLPHMVNGKIAGKFTFRKQGANYGCYLITPTEPAA